MSCHIRMQAHCIVQAGFDVTCTMRCSTVEIADTDCDWLSAFMEIRAYRCTEQSELIFLSRFNADNRAGCKHIWS